MSITSQPDTFSYSIDSSRRLQLHHPDARTKFIKHRYDFVSSDIELHPNQGSSGPWNVSLIMKMLNGERRAHADDGTMVLACHASPGSQTAGFDQALDPTTWRALTFAPHDKGNPFFFFNACDTGRARSLGGFVQGWGPAVLASGASGFIGGMWPLTDQTAASFSTSFYGGIADHLKTGPVYLAEVLLHTSELARATGVDAVALLTASRVRIHQPDEAIARRVAKLPTSLADGFAAHGDAAGVKQARDPVHRGGDAPSLKQILHQMFA